MHKRIPLVFYILLFIYPQILGKTVLQKMILETEEKIQEITFKHIVESGSVHKEIFLINNIPVLKSDYQARLEQAEKEEREYERKMESDLLHSRVQFASNTQLSIYQKMLSKIFINIKQWLAKLRIEAISSYYVFSPDTVSSRASFESFKDDVFMKAQQLMQEYMQLQDIDSLKKLFEQYEAVPQRLERFFQKSVQQAIKHCDDTKVLKELLEIIGAAD
jgi:hypothetical protein